MWLGRPTGLRPPRPRRPLRSLQAAVRRLRAWPLQPRRPAPWRRRRHRLAPRHREDLLRQNLPQRRPPWLLLRPRARQRRPRIVLLRQLPAPRLASFCRCCLWAAQSPAWSVVIRSARAHAPCPRHDKGRKLGQGAQGVVWISIYVTQHFSHIFGSRARARNSSACGGCMCASRALLIASRRVFWRVRSPPGALRNLGAEVPTVLQCEV